MTVGQFLAQIRSLCGRRGTSLRLDPDVEDVSLQDAKKTHTVHLLVLEEAILLDTLITEDLTQLAVAIAPAVKVVRQSTPRLSLRDLSTYGLSPSVTALLSGLLALAQTDRRQTHFIDPSIAQDAPRPSSALTLDQCLQQYFHQEVLDLREGYRCEHCHQVVDVMRETVMEHVPSVMILHLMRFSYDQYTPVKLFEQVKYPVHVGLAARGNA